MGSATWRCEAYVDGSPDEVYAWMTDLGPDDHGSAAYKRGARIDPAKKQKPSSRRVLSRQGNVLEIEDTWDGSTWKQTVTFDPAARSVRIQGGFGYDSTWRATPEGSGTRVVVEGQLGRGIVGSIMKLFESKTRKGMQQDFDGHLEELRETLAGKRATAPR